MSQKDFGYKILESFFIDEKFFQLYIKMLKNTAIPLV